MRIVYLITVGAFLLSIAIAESDVPNGTPQYHQRAPRPIILQPVVTYATKNEDHPLNWFINMMSRVMDPPKKIVSSMIGPISLPGMGGHVYIRQTENAFPWESNRVVVRMMTRDPVTGISMPLDSGPPYHRMEDSSRRVIKPHGYQTINNPPNRPNNMMQQGFQPSSSSPQYSSWQGQQRNRLQQYSSPHSKPLRGFSPNDFRHEDYGKRDQSFSKGYSDGPSRPFYNNYQRSPSMSGANQPNQNSGGSINSMSSASMYRPVAHETPNDSGYSGNEVNDQRFKESMQDSNRGESFYSDSRKPDSSMPPQVLYPVYPPLREDEIILPKKNGNESSVIDNNAGDAFRDSSPFRQVIRPDRMVPIIDSNRERFGASESRGRTLGFNNHRDQQKFRGFRKGSSAKFDSEVVGGLEVVSAPNLKDGWIGEPITIDSSEDQNRNQATASRDSDSELTQNEDSMSFGDGQSLARGESTEHAIEQPEDSSIDSRTGTPVIYSKIIDRSHRSQGSQKIPSDSSESFIEDKRNLSPDSSRKFQGHEREEIKSNVGINNVTAEVVQKVVNLTASNRWRFQDRRTPRVVKTIYRRKPVEVLKSNRESLDSGSSNEDMISTETSTKN